MTTFVTPVAHGTPLQRVTPSAPLPAGTTPALRFGGDPIMWIGVPAGTPIAAFATGGVVRTTAASVPGVTAVACTIFQFSPLPQMNAAAFNAILGGLPVQMVIVTGTVSTPATDDMLIAGATLATAPSGSGSTAFLAFAFQDRICRDPLSWAEAIAASGACDANWPQFIQDLAALSNARNLRLVDHRGVPLAGGSVSIAIDGGAAQPVTIAADGETGIAVPAGSHATVVATGLTNPIVAGVDVPASAPFDQFTNSGLQLPAGKRIAQVLDANSWFASPTRDVQVARWHPNNNVETIQEGTPYFGRLVDAVRRAKPAGGAPAGAVGLAGWAFVKGSLKDLSVDWPLVPGDSSTTILSLINELHGAGVNVRLLVNQFLQWDEPTIDDAGFIIPVLFAFFASLVPAQLLLKLQTDPQGYVVGFLAVNALSGVLASAATEYIANKELEYSQPLMDALQDIDSTIAKWTPYPAAFADNPLVTVPPTILGVTLDDISHIGVYHQKYVIVKPSQGDVFAFLGGIDINSDRPDTTIHRAEHPFHDVQVCLTGPAVIEVIRSYVERATLHNAPIPIQIPTDPIPGPGSHLVQIARTYFAPKPGSPTQPLSFAPHGDTTSADTIIAAIRQAKDYIYIEDQYFTPSNSYVDALLTAADNGVRALMITMPISTDQPYGSIRRSDVLNALSSKWGARFSAGTPVRRYLHEVPGLVTNLGRMSLAADLDAGATTAVLQPIVRFPAPPFWAFIGNELVLVYAMSGPPTATTQMVEILRPGGAPSWGAQPIDHSANTPVLAVQLPGIYVHAKVMIIDDVFLFVGSSNVNRRGHYHDGEMNSFTIPQRLRSDPTNPARILRSRLMAEHLGLSPENGAGTICRRALRASLLQRHLVRGRTPAAFGFLRFGAARRADWDLVVDSRLPAPGIAGGGTGDSRQGRHLATDGRSHHDPRPVVDGAGPRVLMQITFFDLLGIDPSLADRAGAAAAIWPKAMASMTQGLHTGDDSLTIVNDLQQGLTFTNVRPGVDPSANFGTTPGQIAFAADMAVAGPFATSNPFYLGAMPDVGIQLQATDPDHPAAVFFARDGRGWELIVDKLPVTVLLKEGTISSLTSSAVTVGTFDPTAIDSFAYTLNDDTQPSTLQMFVRLQVTTEGNVIIEPTVPISFGPCLLLGIPAKAVYDVLLIPSPNRRDYYEWAHNALDSFFSNPPVKGALGFRSLDVDLSLPPFSDLKSRLQTGAVNVDTLQLVMEDVVLPLFGVLGPIPSHGTFGFRRKITDRGDIKEAYSFANAPVQIPFYTSRGDGGNGGTPLIVEVDNFFFQTGDVGAIDPADQPQILFDTKLIYQATTGQKIGARVAIDAEWLLNAGIVLDPSTTPAQMVIAGTTVGVVGLKFGVSITRLCKKMQFTDSIELVGDLFVSGAPPSTNNVFQIASLTGKPLQIVIHDIGWKLGTLTLSGLQMPDGMQIIFAKTVAIIIEEMGWVEEPNGTPYFSFSGGIAIGAGGGQRTTPVGEGSDSSSSGFGIRVRRLRFRLNSDSSQPLFKLNGVFLNLSYGPVTVSGFGYISNYVDSGWTINEWGFGVSVSLALGIGTFQLSAEFVKGNRRNIATPSQQFDYFLAALSLGYLPAGPVALYDIRALVADNMAPNLDSTFPDGEGMALLKWHQNHDQALTFPANRTLADWIPEDGAFSLGVGTGFSINGAGGAVHIDAFIFFSKSAADTGILIVGDLFLLKNPNPVAFVAVEYDISSGKFGVMVGVSFRLSDFVPVNVPEWVNNIARLTGSLYVGNQPWTFAVGQLADQSTWLTFKVDFDIWVMVEKVLFAVCVQIVDGGPKGFALVVQIATSTTWGIGQFILFGSFGLIIGAWKTGSDSSGFEFWIQIGFKINLFFVFSFGAEIGMKITYLGRTPWYATVHGEVKIDTPWFLPDVTFSFDKTYQSPQPFDVSTLNQSLSQSSGIDPTQSQAQPLLVPGLSDGVNDPTTVYPFNTLNGLTGVRIADTLSQNVPLVSVDATITLDFTNPISNDSGIATSTYGGTTDTGVQQVQDITARYGLTSIAVRRAPRFGPTAGQWTDFLTDAETQLTIGGDAPEYLTFIWDADSRADGQLAPKRLLMNSASPYSFTTSAPRSDEEAVKHDPNFPCCSARRGRLPRPYELTFAELGIGSRAPARQQFTGPTPNGNWWSWDIAPTPTITMGWPVNSTPVARCMPRVSATLAHVDCATPVAAANVSVQWSAMPAVLYFEGYRGLDLVAQQALDLHTTGSATVALNLSDAAASAGVTRLTLRVAMDPGAVFAGLGSLYAAAGYASYAGIEIQEANYTTVADIKAYLVNQQTCRNVSNVGPPGSDAAGKLAFLPNHDYEVVVTTSISLGTVSQGARQLALSEATYFRTKGLPGLNACGNVGDDIRLHVAATYPIQRAILLYREEPCVLAFENSLSSILPIDRAPGPDDPPEKAQMFSLELNVDRVASLSGLQRLTMPTNDWITAHRPHPHPPTIYVAATGFAESKVRYAPSNDPLVRRFETIQAASGSSCGAPAVSHASQVLLHEPIDATGAAGLWEPKTGYRATVRQAGGPFTERTGFDIYDAMAFTVQSDGPLAWPEWGVDGSGNLVAPNVSGGRQYFTCGDTDWDHLQVHARVDLQSAQAVGFAVGVGSGTPVSQAMICTIETDGSGHALVVRSRLGGTETELARATISVSGPVLLTVVAFDDVVRATVGDVSVSGARNAVREGRVALVASGPATFAGIAVGALDIYAFEFVTSRFASFAEHLGTYDGTTAVLAAGAFGGTPASIATVYPASAVAIASMMQPSADPQARQKLFDSVLTQLAIGLKTSRLGVTIARLTDANGTFGWLLESPEAISITRDVTIAVTRASRVWVNAPIAVRPARAALSVSGVAAMALGGPSETEADDNATLEMLQFDAERVAVFGTISPGADDQILRVVDGGTGGVRVQIFAAPSGAANGDLLETLTATQATKRFGAAAVADLRAGVAAIVHKGVVGSIARGYWETIQVPVPITILSNGIEDSLLILSAGTAPLGPGVYTMVATMDRDRWSATTEADPEQHYHDSATLTVSW